MPDRPKSSSITRENIVAEQELTQLRASVRRLSQDNARLRASVEKMEHDDLAKKVKSLERRSTMYEMIGSRIIQAVQALPPLPPVEPIVRAALKAGQSEEEAILLISDIQAGLKMTFGESGGLGTFNMTIIMKELAQLQEKVISILTRYHPNVRRLHVFFLGDNVEGSMIYGGQLRQIDMNVIQQTLFLWDALNIFLLALSSVFVQVSCYGVVGNHGRVGFKGEHAPMENFDYMLYRMLKERLKTVRNITWSVAETWYEVVNVLGWKWLIVHGDDSPSGFAGIPFYGLSRHKRNYRELFMELKREYGDFDYMAVGHFSTAATFQKIHMNGAWPPGTEFSLKRLQLGDDPSQTLLGMSKKYGVTWRRDIKLLSGSIRH